MRTLKELNEVILEKYKTFEQHSKLYAVCLCLFVRYELTKKEIITREEFELWYSNFLNYKPSEIKHSECRWWDMGSKKEDITKRIEVLTKIVEDDKLIIS
jgi:hypothetical protein